MIGLISETFSTFLCERFDDSLELVVGAVDGCEELAHLNLGLIDDREIDIRFSQGEEIEEESVEGPLREPPLLELGEVVSGIDAEGNGLVIRYNEFENNGLPPPDVSDVLMTDYDGAARPQGAGFDIGSYEYPP